MGVVSFNEAKATKKNSVQEEKKLFVYYDGVIDIMLTYQLNAAKTKDALYPLSYSFTKEKFLSENFKITYSCLTI